MAMRVTSRAGIERAVTSVALGLLGLGVLVIPSSVSASIAACLAIAAIGIALSARAKTDEDGTPRSVANAGIVIGVVVIADIFIGLGITW